MRHAGMLILPLERRAVHLHANVPAHAYLLCVRARAAPLAKPPERAIWEWVWRQTNESVGGGGRLRSKKEPGRMSSNKGAGHNTGQFTLTSYNDCGGCWRWTFWTCADKTLPHFRSETAFVSHVHMYGGRSALMGSPVRSVRVVQTNLLFCTWGSHSMESFQHQELRNQQNSNFCCASQCVICHFK
jgi:hypothetical protein